MQPGPLGSLIHARIEQQNVQLVLAELLETLLRKGLDASQVREVQWQDGQVVRGRVVVYFVEGRLGFRHVSCADDELVGLLRLAKELFDCFEALFRPPC